MIILILTIIYDISILIRKGISSSFVNDISNRITNNINSHTI